MSPANGPADGGTISSKPPGGATPQTPRDRKPEGPRRVRGGVKLRSKDGAIERTPLADALIDRLEHALPVEARTDGLRYAQLGQIVSMEITSGQVTGRVQGIPAQPYETRLVFGAFEPTHWKSIIAAMASEAVYLVKLMNDELPEGMDDLLASLDLVLVPPAEGIRFECTCPARGLCKHAAAVGYVLAEQCASTPLQIFSIRGMTPARLGERVRQERLIQTRGSAAAHADPMIPESRTPTAPLAECVEEFWRPPHGASSGEHASPPTYVTHALLRRLGPSPLRGRFPLVGLLASIYDTVSHRAVELRDQAEHLSGGNGGESGGAVADDEPDAEDTDEGK